MLENIGNTITRLTIYLLRRNLAARIPSCSRHVRQNGVAMATVVAWQRPLPGNGRCLATTRCTFSSYGRLEAERVNQF